MLKAEFVESLARVLPQGEALELCKVLEEGMAEVSVRLNPDKPIDDGLEPQAELQCGDVPWFSIYGRYLSQRPVFTTDPLLHGGGYYVQEASSMMVGWVFDRLLERGFVSDLSPLVLDLCAAPGGKSTLLASLVRPMGGVVVANEVIRQRARVLSENVQKWGLDNVAVTSSDAVNFGALGEFFDVVLVDAPCSGEGMFRKDPQAQDEWSLANVEQCAQRGRRIVGDVWDSLKEGGVMIYSTCTFNNIENEQAAEWIARELGGEVLDLGPCGSAVVQSSGGGYRFYPHLVRGEGFYVVAILKTTTSGNLFRADRTRRGKGGTLTDLSKAQIMEAQRFVEPHLQFGIGGGAVYGFSESLYPLINTLGASVGLVYSGVMLGEFMRDSLKPAHSLATYYGLRRESVAVSKVDYPLAMEYLRKGALDAALFQDGLSLVEYRGLGLGWIKRITNRCNNLYPNNWRVLNV